MAHENDGIVEIARPKISRTPIAAGEVKFYAPVAANQIALGSKPIFETDFAQILGPDTISVSERAKNYIQATSSVGVIVGANHTLASSNYAIYGGKPTSLTLSAESRAKRRLWIDEDDVSAMRALFDNISYKNIIQSEQENLKSTQRMLPLTLGPADKTLQALDQTPAQDEGLTVSAGGLGIIMFIFFGGLITTSYLSGIAYVHPVIGIGGAVSGIVFVIMYFLGRRAPPLR